MGELVDLFSGREIPEEVEPELDVEVPLSHEDITEFEQVVEAMLESQDDPARFIAFMEEVRSRVLAWPHV